MNYTFSQKKNKEEKINNKIEKDKIIVENEREEKDEEDLSRGMFRMTNTI